MAEFAMVEELAFLIKDNLSCKHLILSIEEVLVDILQENESPDGVLELQPMSPYQRMLLHRLADIYGFAHESVGEGDDRHLILERCPESSIPPVLVSDILWQYDEYQSPKTSHQLLRRKETLPVSKTEQQPPYLPSAPLEEREAAYLAARERIFSLAEGERKELIPPKPRNIPVVARRMIAHALGQKISSSANEKQSLPKSPKYAGPNKDFVIKNEHESGSSMQAALWSSLLSDRDSSSTEGKMHSKQLAGETSHASCVLQSENNCSESDKDSLEQEQIGAAKRIFAQALGLPSAKENHTLMLNWKQGSKTQNRQGIGIEKLRI